MSGASPEEGMYMVCSWVRRSSRGSAEEKEDGIGNWARKVTKDQTIQQLLKQVAGT